MNDIDTDDMRPVLVIALRSDYRYPVLAVAVGEKSRAGECYVLVCKWTIRVRRPVLIERIMLITAIFVCLAVWLWAKK